MPNTKKLSIVTNDGKAIAATLFQSKPGRPHLIIICPASGAPQFYYHKFASFAADNFEYDVVTFDYRGIGESRFNRIRDDRSCMSDWGTYDLKSVIDWGSGRYDKIFLVGHSIAGQIFPKAKNSDRITAAYFVASQTAYHGFWKGWSWIKVLFFWYFALPISTTLFKCLPGWMLGGNVSLPKNCANEWRKWGTHRNGVLQNDEKLRAQFNALSIPMHFISIEDDRTFAPASATQELMHYYGNATTTFQFIRPRDLGLKKIGHFGFFKSAHERKLWSMPILFFTQYIEKLEAS